MPATLSVINVMSRLYLSSWKRFLLPLTIFLRKFIVSIIVFMECLLRLFSQWR